MVGKARSVMVCSTRRQSPESLSRGCTTERETSEPVTTTSPRSCGSSPADGGGVSARAVAAASQRYVYGDFRVVDMLGRRNAAESTAQFAAEVVMRTSTW